MSKNINSRSNSYDPSEYFGFHRISYNKKKASNWKWLEDTAEHYYNYHDDQNLRKWQKQIEINYEYANARGGSQLEQDKIRNTLFAGNRAGEPVSNDLKHYDILRRVLNRNWGEQQKSKLKGIVVDTSKYNQNFKKKKKLELYQDFVKQTLLDPLEQEITQSVFAKHGIQNPQQLNPDQQQQISSEIQQELQFKTPGDIEKFMRKDYKSPSETELQNLVDWMIKEYNLKYISNECYKDLTIAGFNGVEMDIRNNRPWIRQINPEMFRYFNSNDESPFISDGDWWISDREIGYSSFISEFATDEKMYKKFREAVLTGGSSDAYRRQLRGEIPHNMTNWLASNANSSNIIGELDPYTQELNIPDINSPGGQSFYRTLMNEYGSERRGNNAKSFDTVFTSRIVIKSLDKLYCVKREDPHNKGEYQTFWLGENYTPDPRKDKYVEEVWAPAYYEVMRAGHSKCLYWGHKRCEFQNRSVNDPFTIYAPFEGVEFSKLHGNTERVAPINFGMPYNYEYDVVKNSMERIQEQDFGNKFLIPEDAIPDKYELDEYLELAKVSPILPISLSNMEYMQAAANIFKGIDLTRNQEIAAKMQQLDRIERECQEALSYSPSAMGQAAPSMTATNNQQNIIQTSYANQDLNGLHKMFEQRMLNTFANLIRNGLRENKQMSQYLLSDLGIAELKLSPDTLHQSEIGITVINDMQEVQNMQSFKNLLQPMIQNQMVSSAQAIKIQFSDNPAELINLAEEAEKKVEMKQQQMQEAQQKAQQEAMELQRQQMELQLKFKEMELKLKEREIETNYDVDDNNRSDLIDQALITLESKERIEAAKIESAEKIKKAELEQDASVLKENTIIKNKEIAQQAKESNDTKAIKLKELSIKNKEKTLKK